MTAVEDRGHPGQPTEMDVQRAERCDYQEIWQDKRPAAGPRAPEAAAQIGDEDADLDRERTGQRLADGHGIAHFLPGQPLAFTYELLFHQPDKGDRTAKAQGSKAEEICNDLAHGAPMRQFGGERLGARRFRCRHIFFLLCLSGSRVRVEPSAIRAVAERSVTTHNQRRLRSIHPQARFANWPLLLFPIVDGKRRDSRVIEARLRLRHNQCDCGFRFN